MTTTRVQFGMRENTASSRLHASRSAANTPSNSVYLEESQQPGQPRARATPLTTGFGSPSQAPLRNAATGERRSGENCLLTVHEVAQLLQVPVSWVYGRMRKRAIERLPGFRLGKYWRFSEREVLAWVATQRGGRNAA